jgi:hypothetical protein
MYIRFTLTQDISDSRWYVSKWEIAKTRVLDTDTIKTLCIKDVPFDFFSDSLRYYFDDSTIRKNPHRVLTK